MDIYQGVKSLKSNLSASVLCLGSFDGIHIGHREIIKRVVELSLRKSIPSVLLTFVPHPQKVLNPSASFQNIYPIERVREMIEALGIDIVVEEGFDINLAQKESELFFLENILNPFNPKAMVVGSDFSFGLKRKGDIEYLGQKSRNHGFELYVFDDILLHQKRASSSRIRSALREGKMRLANDLLGHTYYVRGPVEKGDSRGRSLGFPTANLRAPDIILKNGVYASTLSVEHKTYLAVSNVGLRPTFYSGSNVNIETHIIDREIELYGKNICVRFLDFIRPELKFNSVESLSFQISKDIAEAKKIF